MKKMNSYRAVVTSSLIFTASLNQGCEKKIAPGFGLEGSAIRYETVKFEDSKQLAEANGIKITTSQILDKSPVIRDLDHQLNDILIGQTYLRVADKNKNADGVVEIYLPKSDTELRAILMRFDREPSPKLSIAYKAAPAADVVGTYKGVAIKREELNPENNLLQSIEQRRFNETASQLNDQLSRILLNEEAVKQKQSLKEYVDARVLKGEPITLFENDVQQLTKKVGLAESEITPELRARLEQTLKQKKEQAKIEEYVAREILKGPIKVSFSAPHSNIKLNDSWKPVAGYGDAPVAIVAFSGSTCPDCPAFIQLVNSTMKKYDGYLKLNWIHMFNPNDGVARMMGEASLCFEAIRPGTSLTFLNDFSAQASQLDETAFYKWAGEHKVDQEAFKTCFVQRQQGTVLDQHLQYAKQTGIVANPTIWVDGKMIEGVVKEDDLDRTVTEKINAANPSWFSAWIRRFKAKFS